MKVIWAKYNEKKEFKLDKKGFFTILLFYDQGIVKVRHYDQNHKITHTIYGKNVNEIYYTACRLNLFGDYRHACYFGKALTMAFIAIEKRVQFEQDSAWNYSFTGDEIDCDFPKTKILSFKPINKGTYCVLFDIKESQTGVFVSKSSNMNNLTTLKSKIPKEFKKYKIKNVLRVYSTIDYYKRMLETFEVVSNKKLAKDVFCFNKKVTILKLIEIMK